MIVEDFLNYIKTLRRYSDNTIRNYSDVLSLFVSYSLEDSSSDSDIINSLNTTSLRNYEVYLMDEKKLGARTVNLHLSVLSSFCKYLMKRDLIQANVLSLVQRPKQKKRLPEFYKLEAVQKYFSEKSYVLTEDRLEIQALGGESAKAIYVEILHYMIVSLLYNTAMRRSELISLTIASFNPARKVLRLKGKGDKVREIPISDLLCREILLYLKSTTIFLERERRPDESLLIAPSGRSLYPVYVDRAVKSELSDFMEFSGRKSPHVLRHTLATELLDKGADLNSIKELLGHSSLAATQVYTHNSIEKLKSVYANAHPRAKKGGNNGD